MSRSKKPAAGRLHTQIGPFTIIPNWVIAACHEARALKLYAVLQTFANREGRAWPTRAQLLELMGGSGRTLDRAVATLKTIHALEVRLRHRDDGAVVGADYYLMQAPPADTLFATYGEKVPDADIATDGEKESEPFRQNQRPISPRAATVQKEELDPDNQIQEQRPAPPAPLRSIAGTEFRELNAAKPAEAFLLVWNTTIRQPLLPVRTLTPKRKRLIDARLAQATDLIALEPLLAGLTSIDIWRFVIARIAASPFCCGSKDWIASLDWLIASPDPAVKALEGQFDDRRARPRLVDGPVTDHELAIALRILINDHGNHCPHEPQRHVDRNFCAEAIALEQREKRRQAS